MSRFVNLAVTLVFIAILGLSTSPGSAAAPPEPQPVTLPCATNMSVQVLGNTQPAAAEEQSLVLVRPVGEGMMGDMGDMGDMAEATPEA
jgi:hypothetical protein